MEGNQAVYRYGGGRVSFEVRLDCLRRTIIVEDRASLAGLRPCLPAGVDALGLDVQVGDARRLALMRQGETVLWIETYRVWGDRVVATDYPCVVVVAAPTPTAPDRPVAPRTRSRFR